MLIEENLKLKETEKLINKLIDLIYLQASEIDLIHFKLYKLEGNLKKAKEVLEISKNIKEEIKQELLKRLEEDESKEIKTEEDERL